MQGLLATVFPSFACFTPDPADEPTPYAEVLASVLAMGLGIAVDLLATRACSMFSFAMPGYVQNQVTNLQLKGIH